MAWLDPHRSHFSFFSLYCRRSDSTRFRPSRRQWHQTVTYEPGRRFEEGPLTSLFRASRFNLVIGANCGLIKFERSLSNGNLHHVTSLDSTGGSESERQSQTSRRRPKGFQETRRGNKR